MTEPAIRIRAYFAKEAPVCILLRRGPSRWSHMIKWHTDTDEFQVGQWIKGRVDRFTMTKDGKYAAIEVMTGDQYVAVCRPPYFAPIEISYGGLCALSAYFLPGNRLHFSEGRHEVNSKTPCPFERVTYLQSLSQSSFEHHEFNTSDGPIRAFDQRGRQVRIEDGQVFVVDDLKIRQLFDMRALRPTEIEIPEWARDY